MKILGFIKTIRLFQTDMAYKKWNKTQNKSYLKMLFFKHEPHGLLRNYEIILEGHNHFTYMTE